MGAQLPNEQEWQAINGGEPTLLESPDSKLYEIIHPNGAIVPTPAEQLLGSLSASNLLRLNVHGKDITVPAVLLWKYHGQPCEERSGSGSDGYKRIPEEKINEHIANQVAAGWRQKSLQVSSKSDQQ